MKRAGVVLTARSGEAVTVENASWNGPVASRGSADLGFVGVRSGTNPAPTPGTTTTAPATTAPAQPAAGAAPAPRVSGSKPVTAPGRTYRLLGVNRSGGELACLHGNGFRDGPVDAAPVDAVRNWRARAVRVPLNEECWPGTADVKPRHGGAAHQNAVRTYVNLLTGKGITPIVETDGNHGQHAGKSAGLYNWAGPEGIGYLGWTWNTWDCSGPSLIGNDHGTATPFGQGLKAAPAKASS